MPMIEIEAMEDLQHAALCCPQCAAANLPQRKFCASAGPPCGNRASNAATWPQRAKPTAAPAGPIAPNSPPVSWNASRPTSAPPPRCRPTAASTMPWPCWSPSPSTTTRDWSNTLAEQNNAFSNWRPIAFGGGRRPTKTAVARGAVRGLRFRRRRRHPRPTAALATQSGHLGAGRPAHGPA